MKFAADQHRLASGRFIHPRRLLPARTTEAGDAAIGLPDGAYGRIIHSLTPARPRSTITAGGQLECLFLVARKPRGATPRCPPPRLGSEMVFDINTEQFAVIAGIGVVIILLVASILITPDRGPKGGTNGEKGEDE